MSFGSEQNSSDRRGVPQLVPTGEHKGKPPILLNRPIFQIGARDSCRIKLVSSTVSQVHAIIVQTRHLTYIRDLCSRNHVYVNDEQIKEQPLNDGDHIKIGRFEFVYRGPKRVHGDEIPALPATLEVTGSPMPVPIEERVILIGRRRTADIPLLEESVSNAHAVIFQWESKRFIRDLGSRTGTYRNGKKIHEKELKAGDVIKVGETEIRYVPSTEMAAAEIVDSATDSQIAAAPSAEEVDFGVDLTASARKVVEPDFSKLSDTLNDLDVVESSHHDTAMIPLSLTRSDLADTASASAHGLEMIPENSPAAEPMPRSWRQASNGDLPPLVVEATPNEPPVTVESVAREEATDLGLAADLADLSPTFPPADPIELVNEPAAEEGNVTIDLSVVDFVPTEPEVAPAPEEVSEAPLIASEPMELAPEPVEQAVDVPVEVPAESVIEAQVEVPAEPVVEAAVEIRSEPVIEVPVEPVLEEPAVVEEVLPANIEVIEPTEPTPESALDLPETPIEDTLSVVEPDALSDTSFSRQVNEFTESSGEIVEPTLPSDEAAIELPPAEPAPVEEPAAIELPVIEEPQVEPQLVEESLDLVNLEDLALDAIAEPEPEIAEVPATPIDESPINAEPVEPAPIEPAPVEPTIEAAELNLDIVPEPDAPAEVVNLDELAPVHPPEPLLEFAAPDEPTINLSAPIEPVPDIVCDPEAPAEVVNLDELSLNQFNQNLASEPSLILPAVEALPSQPAEVVNLDDLALDALNEPASPASQPERITLDVAEPLAPEAVIEPAIQEQPPQLFGATMPAPVETINELPIPEEAVAPAVGEGNAIITPATESVVDATATSELSSADLISPPVVPLAPGLTEIDLGIETLPDVPPVSGDAGTVTSLTDLGGGVVQDPFDVPSLAVPMPPRPLKKRRDRDKPTVIRKFGQEIAEESQASAESPFAGAKAGQDATISEFPAAIAGSVDVFGSASPTGADELLSSLSGKLSDSTDELKSDAGRRRAGDAAQRIAPRPVQSITDSTALRRPGVTYNDAGALQADGEAKRRKLLRRIPVVLVIGIVLAAAAAFAAPRFFPIVYEIQASVRFENLQASSRNVQQIFQESQLKTIFNESTRRAALQKLKDRYPQIEPGFLGNSDDYFQAVARTDWSNKQPGLLTIRYAGKEKTQDMARVLALALAIHQNNSDLAMRSSDAKRNLAEVNKICDRMTSQIAELTEQIEKDRLTAERYQPEKLTAATTQVQQLEKLYNDSIAALKSAQAELDRLKKSSPNAAVTQPGDAIKPADDQELAELTRKAAEMAAKLAQARSERAELAKQARESLDAAYEQFQKQITSAQGAMQQSPELAKFVETAQSQLKTIREMTDEFIATQQTEYQQLAEIKAKLDDKMQSRRADLWAKDEQLQQLAEQREITIRKINAAKSDNLEKEVADLGNDLNLIEGSIKARQDVLATDPLYADVINSLQQIIETKQKQLVENRKKTDQKLADFQKQFAASLPTVEKLPQEQQTLAADMKQRLAEIDSARRQYAAAADTAGLENDAVIKSMTQQLASMQGDIEVRKQQMLAAANGAVAKQVTEQIAAKEKEIVELTSQQEKAQQSFFAAQAQQREMQQARADAEAAINHRYEAQKQKELCEAQKTQSLSDLKAKTLAVEQAIEPKEPTEADVNILHEDDHRWTASIASGGGVLLITGIYVLLLAYAAAKANPFPHHNVEPEAQSTEEEPHENQPAVV